MNQPRPRSSGAPPAPDSIDFEPTDFDTARGALDEPPPGVQALRDSRIDWVSRRRVPTQLDLRLQDATMMWLRSLDPAMRPRELAARFPRLANRLAACWHDPTETMRVIGELVLDSRGGRRGFPLGVATELTALHELLMTRQRLVPGRR